MLVVHGRTKEQKKENTGPANWEIVKRIKQALKIPVVSNGGIQKVSQPQLLPLLVLITATSP